LEGEILSIKEVVKIAKKRFRLKELFSKIWPFILLALLLLILIIGAGL